MRLVSGHGQHHLRSPQVCRSPEGERGAGRAGPRDADALAQALADTPDVASKADIELKPLIAETKSEILKWMFGSVVAEMAVIIALLKLLPRRLPPSPSPKRARAEGSPAVPSPAPPGRGPGGRALSRRERGRWCAGPSPEGEGFATACCRLIPLPAGEGWGEGEPTFSPQAASVDFRAVCG
jgi:hypothetical protein